MSHIPSVLSTIISHVIAKQSRILEEMRLIIIYYYYYYFDVLCALNIAYFICLKKTIHCYRMYLHLRRHSFPLSRYQYNLTGKYFIFLNLYL